MGVEVAGGTTELTADAHGVEHLELTAQTVGKHLYLFTKTCGRGWLSVGLGEHGYVVPLVGTRIEMLNHLHETRTIYVADGVSYRHGHGCVVDVLRGEAEVYEFLTGLESENVETLLEEIFHGLDVVVGHALDLLDARGILDCEVLVDVAQRTKHIMAHRGERAERYLAESYEILYLDFDTVAYEGIFREVFIKSFALVTVSPVHGRDGCKLGKIHCCGALNCGFVMIISAKVIKSADMYIIEVCTGSKKQYSTICCKTCLFIWNCIVIDCIFAE